MKAIKKFVFLLLLIFLNQIAFSQFANCEKSKILKSEKILLQKFWSKFRDAINSNSKVKLASLIRFPFKCGYCDDARLLIENSDYIVTNKYFDLEYNKVFFNPKLIKTINEESIFDLIGYSFHGDLCYYNFGFVSIPSSAKSEGQYTLFVLSKIKGKYYITATWTVP